MQTTKQFLYKVGAITPTRRMKTNLYDLISTIADESPIKDDHLIADAVTHLLKSGRAKFIHY
jgi:hypothetical protein